MLQRKRVRLRTINLEEGRPTLEQARLRLDHALALARHDGISLLKLIHGYGSSGAGGVLRDGIQSELRRLQAAGEIRGFIIGEQWRVSDEQTWKLLQRDKDLKHDPDLGRSNRGITIVVL